MTRLLSTTALLLTIATPTLAHTGHHHYRHHHRYSRHYRHRDDTAVASARSEGIKLIEEDTAAGKIRVDAAYANRFKDLIADFDLAGYHMRNVHCWAPVGTHVRHSRHYLGQACDFNQSGWGKTDHFMYTHEAAAIIEKHGFTNGCSFRDCGHVGTDGQGHGTRYAPRRTHYAHHHMRHYARV